MMMTIFFSLSFDIANRRAIESDLLVIERRRVIEVQEK